jgi:hypothetical protein
LGRLCWWFKKHFRVFILTQFRCLHLEFKEARDNSSVHCRSIIHYCYLCCQPSNLVEENVKGFGTWTGWSH